MTRHARGLAPWLVLVALWAATPAVARTPERFVAQQRQQLAQARTTLDARLARRTSPVRALRHYSTEVDRLLGAVDAQVVRELGAPPRDPSTGKPVAYELFAMGSYGRKELAPYSDLDYGILTARRDPRIQRYFRRYGRRVGELLQQIDGEGVRPCRSMSPAGDLGDALVDTPGGMAERLLGRSPDFAARPIRTRDYLQSALGNTRPVLARGEGKLHRQLVGQVQRRLGPVWPRVEATGDRRAVIDRLLPSLRDPFGLPDAAADPAWSAGLAAPAPKDPQRAIQQGDVNIKHDILRAFQTPVLVLRQLHGVRANDTVGMLRALARRGHLEPGFARELEHAYKTALGFRARHQLAAGRADDRLGPLSPAEQTALHQMVPLLTRLRRSIDPLKRVDANRFTVR